MTVDPVRSRKIFVIIREMRGLLEQGQLAYPKKDTGEPLSFIEAREWAEQVVRQRIDDHKNPMGPFEDIQLNLVARESVEAQRLKLHAARGGGDFQPERENRLDPRTPSL